jgi:hypothetical protein
MSSKRKQSEDTSPRAAKKAKNSKAEKEDKVKFIMYRTIHVQYLE